MKPRRIEKKHFEIGSAGGRMNVFPEGRFIVEAFR